MTSDYFFNVYIGSVAFFLILCSLLSAVGLQLLGNYFTYYNWSKVLLRNHSIVHISLLLDYIKNWKLLTESDRDAMRDILNEALERDGKHIAAHSDPKSTIFTNYDLFLLALSDNFTDVAKKMIDIERRFYPSERNRTQLCEKLEVQIRLKKNEEFEMILEDLRNEKWAPTETFTVWKQQPMLQSIEKGNLGVLCLLHTFGLNIEVCNADEESAIGLLSRMLEVKNVHRNCFNRILLNYMNKFLFDPEGQSLLQTAISQTNEKSFELLLENGGANVNHQARSQGLFSYKQFCHN